MKIIIARLSILAMIQLVGIVGYLGILQGNAGNFTPVSNRSEEAALVADNTNISILGFMPSEDDCDLSNEAECQIDLHYDVESAANITGVKVYLSNQSLNNHNVDSQDITETHSEPFRMTSSIPTNSNQFNIIQVAAYSGDQLASVQKIGVIIDDSASSKSLNTSLNTLERGLKLANRDESAEDSAEENESVSEEKTDDKVAVRAIISVSTIPNNVGRSISSNQSYTSAQTQVKLLDSVVKNCPQGFNGPNDQGLCTGIVDTKNPINFANSFTSYRWFDSNPGCPAGYSQLNAIFSSNTAQWSPTRFDIDRQANTSNHTGTICNSNAINSSVKLYHASEWSARGSSCPTGFSVLAATEGPGGERGQNPVNIEIKDRSGDSRDYARICIGNGSSNTVNLANNLIFFTERSHGNNCPGDFVRLNIANDPGDSAWNQSRFEWNNGKDRAGFFCMKNTTGCPTGFNLNNNVCQKIGTREATCKAGHRAITAKTCIPS